MIGKLIAAIIIIIVLGLVFWVAVFQPIYVQQPYYQSQRKGRRGKNKKQGGEEIEKFKKDKVIEAGKIYETKDPEFSKKNTGFV
jgi:hypothetical protein